MSESKIIIHDDEFSLDDLKQENNILRNELIKLCQEITVQGETEQTIKQIRDELTFEKLLNQELGRRINYLENERNQLEDRITSYNQHFVEIAAYRMKLTAEESLHKETKGKLQRLEIEHNRLSATNEQTIKVNKNLQRFLKNQQYPLQLKKLAEENTKKEKKLQEVQTAYRNAMMMIQAKNVRCAKLSAQSKTQSEEIEQLHSQLLSFDAKVQSQSKEIVKLHEYIKLLQLKQDFAKEFRRAGVPAKSSSLSSTQPTVLTSEDWMADGEVLSKDCRTAESTTAVAEEVVVEYGSIYQDKEHIQQGHHHNRHGNRHGTKLSHDTGKCPANSSTPLMTEVHTSTPVLYPVEDLVCLDLSALLFGSDSHSHSHSQHRR